jgi:hypothetical protein
MSATSLRSQRTGAAASQNKAAPEGAAVNLDVGLLCALASTTANPARAKQPNGRKCERTWFRHSQRFALGKGVVRRFRDLNTSRLAQAPWQPLPTNPVAIAEFDRITAALRPTLVRRRYCNSCTIGRNSRLASVSHSLCTTSCVATRCDYGEQKKNTPQEQKTTTRRVRHAPLHNLFMRTP